MNIHMSKEEFENLSIREDCQTYKHHQYYRSKHWPRHIFVFNHNVYSTYQYWDCYLVKIDE